ncbi:DoxX family protein [Streptomyces sp. NPDC006658]|uniref:DoxX family protein n=1 Tax=Streptomyces sp. NPDC006658 TaxID=3156900 RepID=UPI0033F0B2C9
MYIAAVILSVLLALASLAAGAPKARLKGSVPDELMAKGLSAGLVRLIGVSEVAAGAGLIVGIWWQPLGIVAAAGMLAVMLGAIGYHLKWGDYADAASRGAATTPVLFCLVAVAAGVTLAASL